MTSKGIQIQGWIACIQQKEIHRFQTEVSQDLKENLSKRDESGRNILHWATSLGSLECVQWLLDKGADVDSQDEALWTPLIIASSVGHEKIVKILLSFGAAIDAKTDQGRTAFFYACSRNRIPIVKILVESKADLNVQDHFGDSPLHRATGVGHVEVLNYLSGQVPHLLVNLKNKEGNTPLHISCEETNLPCLEALLKMGCDHAIVNKAEKKPVEMAPIDYRRKILSIIDRYEMK